MSRASTFAGPSAPAAESWLASIVDSSFDAIVSKNLDSTITNWNRGAERLFGYSAAEAVGRSVLMLIPDHLQTEEREIISRIRSGEVVETYETIRRRKDGTLIEVSLTVSPIRDAAGTIVGASKIARDITATRESERRIRLLMAEVNHRVKNQFAVILSMIRETSRHMTDPAAFQESVRDRIMALARSHDLLVDTEWAGTDLATLVRAHLEPFGPPGAVEIGGPAVSLQPIAIQYLGIALHELATNSAKYGALADPAGAIRIAWEVGRDATGEERFALSWEEVFAPRPAAPAREGFGSKVLRRITPSALGGHGELERSPGRVAWTVRAPLAALRA